MVQCLERSGFDKEKDQLFCLGDVSDRGRDVKECFDELLGVKNLIYILGNHDSWVLQYHAKGEKPEKWEEQGGKETLESYEGKIDEAHIELLKNAKFFHIEDNKVFVHGGFNPSKPIEKQGPKNYLWGRKLAYSAMKNYDHFVDTPLTQYDEVFLGHSPIHRHGHTMPLRNSGVCLMDTGAGHGGKLSMMNIDTHEVFQSDPVSALYKE